VGLAHAYDLTHLLARAIEHAGSIDRARVRDALEQVTDHAGLTGHYPRPFTPQRHEALGVEQLFMARYRRDGAIVPLDYTDPAP
jgi:branched-chain amino acid transport system substrate-binding protein